MGGRISRFGAMCLACTFLVLMLAVPANAYVSLGLSDGRCSPDGSFSMQVKNFGGTPIDLDRVNVTARMNGRDNRTFDVSGAFDRNSLYEGNPYTTTTLFRSTTGNLNESGTYGISITYPDCRYGTCTEELLLGRCPGFSYQCKLADVQIDRCLERNGMLQMYVHGINEKQYQKIDPLRELALSLRSNARTISNQYYADGVTIKSQENDEFIMNVPLKPGEKISEASLELTRCSKPPSLREMDICTIQENNPMDKKTKDMTVAPPAGGASGEEQEQLQAQNDTEDGLDPRTGRNRIEGHASTADTDTATSDEPRNTLSTLVMAGIGILWLAATLLVSIILVRQINK